MQSGLGLLSNLVGTSDEPNEEKLAKAFWIFLSSIAYDFRADLHQDRVRPGSLFATIPADCR